MSRDGVWAGDQVDSTHRPRPGAARVARRPPHLAAPVDPEGPEMRVTGAEGTEAGRRSGRSRVPLSSPAPRRPVGGAGQVGRHSPAAPGLKRDLGEGRGPRGRGGHPKGRGHQGAEGTNEMEGGPRWGVAIIAGRPQQGEVEMCRWSGYLMAGG